MADMLDLLRTRRSVPPQFLAAPGPSPEQLDSLLQIATRVPDHGKLAPWRFILFEGAGREKAGAIIAALFKADHPEADEARLAVERERLSRAPLVVAVVSRAAPHVKIPEWEQQLSAANVCMTLEIAANAMGFGSSWLTEWMAYDRRFLDAIGLAPHERIAGFVHIGRPTITPEDRTRPVLADLVTRF
jgi:nitroreductase